MKGLKPKNKKDTQTFMNVMIRRKSISSHRTFLHPFFWFFIICLDHNWVVDVNPFNSSDRLVTSVGIKDGSRK